MKKIAIISAIILVTLLSATIYAVDKLIYPDKVTVKAHKVFSYDFGETSDEGCALSVGPEGDVLVVASNLPVLTDTEVSLEWVSRQCQTGELKCTLYHFKDGKLKTIPLKSIPGPFPLAQPSGPDRYVVATASSYSPDKELNGYVYDSAGTVTNKLQLGVDTNQMQCDSDGNIWATYDTIQKHENDPLNAGGLTCFDINGKNLFRYNGNTPLKRKSAVTYGLALNVVSPNEVVIGTAMKGEIVKLLNKTSVKPLGVELPDFCGYMAVSDSRLLYSYGTVVEARLAVMDIDDKTDKSSTTNRNSGRISNLNPVDENGQTIEFKERDVACRGSRLYFHNHKTVYYVDVNELDKSL